MEWPDRDALHRRLAHLGGRFTGADLGSANAAFVILYNVGLALGPPVVGGGMDLFPPHGFAWSLAAFFAFTRPS